MRVSVFNLSQGTIEETCMQRCDQGITAIEQLLKALWHSEFLSRLSDYRTGIILLADISLEFGLSTRARRILEEIMPQARLKAWLERY